MARRPEYNLAEKFTLLKEHAQTTATQTIKVYKVPVGRKLRIDRASYINVTGLALDPSNFFVGTLKNGATVAATLFNTNTSGGAALTANTFFDAVLSATDSARIFAAGDIILLVNTLTGTQTLPTGTLILEGRLF
jgi:hypothetical protein